MCFPFLSVDSQIVDVLNCDAFVQCLILVLVINKCISSDQDYTRSVLWTGEESELYVHTSQSGYAAINRYYQY